MEKTSKRIYNKFVFWSVKDCSCEHCLHFHGKNKPCPLDTCCIKDIKQEAKRRESARTNVVMVNAGS